MLCIEQIVFGACVCVGETESTYLFTAEVFLNSLNIFKECVTDKYLKLLCL